MGMRLYGLFPAFCLVFAGSIAMAAPEGDASQNQQQQQAQALADTCAKVACRKQSRSITLRASGSNVARFPTQLFPYLDTKGQLIIYPGETITLALPQDGKGAPALAKVADENGEVEIRPLAGGEASLSFSFKQMDGKPDMLLTVTNSVAATFKYDTVMLAATPNGMRPSPTSTCPLLPPQGSAPSFSGLEHWPYPIALLLISNIRPLAAGDDKSCK